MLLCECDIIDLHACVCACMHVKYSHIGVHIDDAVY